MIVKVITPEVYASGVGTTETRILSVELTNLRNVPVTGLAGVTSEWYIEITDRTKLNKLLNDYSNINATVQNGKLVLDYGSASVESIARKIPETSWKSLVKPAWQRAATTAGFGNL